MRGWIYLIFVLVSLTKIFDEIVSLFVVLAKYVSEL